MWGARVLCEIHETRRAYEEKYDCLPELIRVDSERMKALTRDLTPVALARLAASDYPIYSMRPTDGVCAEGFEDDVAVDHSEITVAPEVREPYDPLESLRPGFGIIPDYPRWLRLADVALDDADERALPSLDAIHLIQAHDWHLAAETRSSGDVDKHTIWALAYVASFGLHGVVFKSLSAEERGWTWMGSDYNEFVLTLRRDLGPRESVSMSPPDGLVSGLSAPRLRWRGAVLDFADKMAGVARHLAR
jgi:hypothetical protein